MALADRLESAVRPEQGGLESTAGPTLTVPCKVASVVFIDAQRRFELYSNLRLVLVLLGLLGIAAAIIIYVAIDDATAAAVVTLIEGLIAGGLAKPVSDERDLAKKDRDAARDIIRTDCEGQTAESIVQAMG